VNIFAATNSAGATERGSPWADTAGLAFW